MKMKKFAALLTSMALAGTVLAGCGDSDSSSSKTSGDSSDEAGKSVSLTVWGSQEDQEMLKSMCESYAAANPKNTYTFTY